MLSNEYSYLNYFCKNIINPIISILMQTEPKTLVDIPPT